MEAAAVGFKGSLYTEFASKDGHDPFSQQLT